MATTKKGGKKPAKTASKKKSTKGSAEDEAPDPLEKFRSGAETAVEESNAAGSSDETGEDDIASHNELIDEELDGQKLIPGAERKGNKKIEAQALKVQDLQARRQELLDEEIEERKKLTAMMTKAGFTAGDHYDLPGTDYEIEMDSSEVKAKVHKKKKTKASE